MTTHSLNKSLRDCVELDCQPGVIRMRGQRSLLDIGKRSLFLLGMLALSNLSIAETYNFKVVYAEVSGTEEIRAGNHDAAIEILQSRAKDANDHYVANELATLCGLYIVKGKLAAARKTCNAAVENDESDAAYNNRGVLRAHLGDTIGGMEDFERVRVLPDNQQRYIEEFMSNDARLVASSNFAVATKYAQSRGHPGQSLANSVRGASIEDLSN